MRPLALATSFAGFALAAVPAVADTVVAGVSPGIAALGGASFGPAAAAPQMQLVPGWRTPEGARVAAIEIRLAPGWHTYWRVPGEAGIPPSFDWSASTNLAAVTYEWPRPELFETSGMQTFGYEQRLVLPVRLKPVDPAAPIELALAAAFGVCSDICIAAEARAALTLLPDAPEAGRDEIEAALAERLRSAAEAGVVRATCAMAPGAGGDEIVATVTFAHPAEPDQIAVIEPGRPDVWIGMPESRVDGRTLTASAPMEVVGAAAGTMLARDEVRLTLLGDDEAVDIRGCQAPD